jgi:metal-responsive CopG/Arc/MetJ family transcriptional regulator
MKEKIERDMYVKVQPSLYKDFKNACDKNYQSVSASIRELMKRYVKENAK